VNDPPLTDWIRVREPRRILVMATVEQTYVGSSYVLTL
jgi:hypothetical protein